MVSRETVQEGHHLTVYSIIDYFIDSGKWEVILRACLVKVCEINTHSSLSIFLLDRDGVGQPGWVFNLSDVFCIE